MNTESNTQAPAATEPGKLGDGATSRCRKCGEQTTIEFNHAQAVTEKPSCCGQTPCAHPGVGPCTKPAATEAPTRHVRAIEYSNDFAGVKLLRYPTEPAPAGEWVKTELSSMPTPVPAVGASDEVAGFAIEVEKMLCAKLGRPWSAAGISIVSLIDALAAAPASVQPVQASPLPAGWKIDKSSDDEYTLANTEGDGALFGLNDPSVRVTVAAMFLRDLLALASSTPTRSAASEVKP